MAERSFDVVVLGAGPAGEVLAGRLADGGMSVAIVEPHLVGGECSFYACMPSKGLLRPGELLAEAKRIEGVRQAVTGDIDADAVLRRRDEIVHDLDDSAQEPWLAKKAIELFRGQGRLDGERRVAVGDDVLVAARAVVVATGSSAAIPPVEGLRDARHWTNREATTAKAVPGRLGILGGGVVGAELAQAYSDLGSKVFLLERGPRLLAKEEPFAAEQVADSLRGNGVDVRLEAGLASVREEEGGLVCVLEGGEELGCDELLVAVGRAPNTGDLGLETVGLEPGKAIEVDDRMRAGGSDWLFAVGDVNKRSELTHMGKYQARVAARVLLGGDAEATEDDFGSPRVTFTDPQVAAVGHTTETAAAAGIPVRVVDAPTQGTAGGSFYGRDEAGTCRLLIDEERRVIVGATFTGFEVGEWIQAATIAIVGQVPLERLWHAVPPFPSRSEVWLNLIEEYGL